MSLEFKIRGRIIELQAEYTYCKINGHTEQQAFAFAKCMELQKLLKD